MHQPIGSRSPIVANPTLNLLGSPHYNGKHPCHGAFLRGTALASSLRRVHFILRRRLFKIMRIITGAALSASLSAASAAFFPLCAQQLASVNTNATVESLDSIVVLGTTRQDITALTSTAPV